MNYSSLEIIEESSIRIGFAGITGQTVDKYSDWPLENSSNFHWTFRLVTNKFGKWKETSGVHFPAVGLLNKELVSVIRRGAFG